MYINPIFIPPGMQIPTVFSEAMSYYECILFLVGRINDIINDLNNFDQNAKNYTDYKVSILAKKHKNDMAEIGKAIKLSEGMLKREIAQIAADCNNNYNRIFALLTDVTELLDITKATLKELLKLKIAQEHAFVQQEINKLYNYIDEQMPDKIKVFNVFRQKMTSITQWTYDYYDLTRWGALTAAQYDALHLTAAEYDHHFLTAVEYDFGGKVFLQRYKNMYSPWTGKPTPEWIVINMLTDFHKDALTAQEYDDLHLKAEVYDAYNLTAYQYDWQGKTLLGNYLIGGVIGS